MAFDGQLVARTGPVARDPPVWSLLRDAPRGNPSGAGGRGGRPGRMGSSCRRTLSQKDAIDRGVSCARAKSRFLFSGAKSRRPRSFPTSEAQLSERTRASRCWRIVINQSVARFSTLFARDFLSLSDARSQRPLLSSSPSLTQRITHLAFALAARPPAPAFGMPYRPATVTETSVIEGYEFPVGKTFAGQEQLPR